MKSNLNLLNEFTVQLCDELSCNNSHILVNASSPDSCSNCIAGCISRKYTHMHTHVSLRVQLLVYAVSNKRMFKDCIHMHLIVFI